MNRAFAYFAAFTGMGTLFLAAMLAAAVVFGNIRITADAGAGASPLGTGRPSSGLALSAGRNLRDRFLAILGAGVAIRGCHREFGQLA